MSDFSAKKVIFWNYCNHKTAKNAKKITIAALFKRAAIVFLKKRLSK
jgi:hypothetical protein